MPSACSRPSLRRRSFLFGRSRGQESVLRPPWAADAFEDLCTRCGECSRVCPTAILIPGGGGFPEVDFSHGECTFCGDCVSACKPGALRYGDGRPWSLALEVGETCITRQGVECRVCGEACGEGAIRFRPRLGGAALPLVEPERCTGCGACVGPCPVGAIRIKQETAMESST